MNFRSCTKKVFYEQSKYVHLLFTQRLNCLHIALFTFSSYAKFLVHKIHLQILLGFLPIFSINPGISKDLEEFTWIHGFFRNQKLCNSRPYCIRKYIIVVFKWNTPTELISTNCVMSRRPFTFINNDFSS